MKTVLGMAVVAALCATGAANAGSVQLFKQNASDTFDGGGKAHVRVEGGPATPVSAYAGGFRLTDSITDFVAWCLDIETHLSIGSGRDYEMTANPFSNTTGEIDSGRVGNIKALFQTAYSTLDLLDNAESGGFQLALWEILYESDGNALSLSDGDFQQTRGHADATAAEAAANGFLSGLGGPVTQQYAFTFWESLPDSQQVRSQNLVSVSEVPLPAAAGFLLIGLGGFAALRRGRRT